MKTRLDVSRLATDREMQIVRDKLRGPHKFVEHINTRKKRLYDNMITLSYCTFCFFLLAAYIKCG